jgi:uncharacterized protein YdaU (DUF1376 family)
MKPASFNFYPNNWLASARITTMLPEQEGAYIRLLAYQWNSEDQTVPASDEDLSALTRLNGRWATCGAKIKACFDPVPGAPGKLRNERLWAEFKRIENLRLHQSAGGKKGMRNRYGKTPITNQEDTSKTVISDLEHTYNREQRTENRDQTTGSREQKEGGAGGDAAGKPPHARKRASHSLVTVPDSLSSLPGWAEAWAAYVTFRTRKRAPVTDRVAATIYSRLAQRPSEAIAALDTCAVAGWTDLRWDWIDKRNAGVEGERVHAQKSWNDLGTGGL